MPMSKEDGRQRYRCVKCGGLFLWLNKDQLCLDCEDL